MEKMLVWHILVLCLFCCKIDNYGGFPKQFLEFLVLARLVNVKNEGALLTAC